MLGMVWAAIGLSLMWAPARAVVNEFSALRVAIFWLGFFGTSCILASWGLALIHWSKSTASSQQGWFRWGAPLLVFSFIAAWAYWLSRQDAGSST